MRGLWSASLILVLSACTGQITGPSGGGGGGGVDGGGAGGGVDAAAATTDLEYCVQETNRLRAMEGKPPLSRSTDLEAFAADSAQIDTEMMSGHYHFSDTGGGGIAFAENECPSFLGWRIQGDVRSSIGACLADFYGEGPGGGHYENMMGDYGALGCGVYVQGDGITIVQDYGN